MEHEIITPKQLFQELWRHKFLILLVSFILTLGAGVYSKLVVTPVYQAKTTLLLKYRSSTSSDVGSDPSRELSGFNLYRNLLKTYVDMANLPIIKEKAMVNYPLSKTDEKSLLYLNTSNIEDSQLIVITARGTDLEILRGYLITYGRTYQQFTKENFGTDNLSILSEAETTGYPIEPNVVRNSVLGAVLGFGMTVVIVLIRYLMADRVRSIEELEQLFDLPVVGILPRHSTKQKVISAPGKRRVQRK